MTKDQLTDVLLIQHGEGMREQIATVLALITEVEMLRMGEKKTLATINRILSDMDGE